MTDIVYLQADFCNPGLLGWFENYFRVNDPIKLFKDDYNTFRRVYETPILKSRAPGCTSKETEVGEARSEQVCLCFILLGSSS